LAFRIVSPEILPYEIANALTAVKRKGRLNDREVLKAFELSQRIPVKQGIHAYDAFYLQCCLETKLPLISLDNRMCEVAKILAIKVVT
jgi:predicted nucleic acid-binding protein